jgi:hypothetical protein
MLLCPRRWLLKNRGLPLGVFDALTSDLEIPLVNLHPNEFAAHFNRRNPCCSASHVRVKDDRIPRNKTNAPPHESGRLLCRVKPSIPLAHKPVVRLAVMPNSSGHIRPCQFSLGMFARRRVRLVPHQPASRARQLVAKVVAAPNHGRPASEQCNIWRRFVAVDFSPNLLHSGATGRITYAIRRVGNHGIESDKLEHLAVIREVQRRQSNSLNSHITSCVLTCASTRTLRMNPRSTG